LGNFPFVERHGHPLARFIAETGQALQDVGGEAALALLAIADDRDSRVCLLLNDLLDGFASRPIELIRVDAAVVLSIEERH
jgi:hypothetical protein